ncbi:MAG TPA: biotin--[acetyl-CoA-carboxylase] ligase [bacterium]|nr:biotin--[acetyl-CoA-carboxylase] ligase [bacterium]
MRTYNIGPTPWRNFYHFGVLDSTNAEAIRLIGKGISSGIVIADRQTAGRGRDGKSWHSPAGKNLYVSFFAKADREQAMNAAKIAGLAAYDAVTAFVPAKRTLLKWPNDILVDKKKLCGILIQHLTRGRDLFTVTGIGLNLTTPGKKAFDWVWEPTSLEEASGGAVEPNAALKELVAALARWTQATAEEIDARYGELVDWMVGAEVRGHVGGADVTGRIARFGEGYRTILMMQNDGVEHEFSAGDILRLFPKQ